jgi:hypothetical protein
MYNKTLTVKRVTVLFELYMTNYFFFLTIELLVIY